MIVLSEERREKAPELESIISQGEPLSARARRAVEAAEAVERGEIDLEQATRKYGVLPALIEAWQHALKAALGRSAHGGKPRTHRC